MRIKKILLKDLGPINNASIEARLTATGNPVPIAIVGQNGAGKSLALSVVLDAFTEARRASFIKLPEVGQSDYLRLSSKNYVRHSASFSHAQATLDTDNGDLTFNEIVSHGSFDEFSKGNPQLLSLPFLQNGEFKDSGFYKNIQISEAQKNDVRKSLFLYFPYFRYEAPYWINEEANVEFAHSKTFHGQSRLNPVRINIIEETKRWILNVLLDRELYEKQFLDEGPQGKLPRVFNGYWGPNATLFDLVNELLSTMLRAKHPQISYARVGIGRKGKREISVIVKHEGCNEEEVIAPDISQLSSGELMTLGLATEIIRAHEVIHLTPPPSLQDVKGTVLIDEIDLHLHISFQKSVLPLILRRFPNVQFVFTTHSPFFLLGMAETGELDIYNFPIGNKIEPRSYEEFQTTYEIFVQQNEQYRKRYEELKLRSQQEAKPLLVTEGKTDWKHLKTALASFQTSDQFQEIDVEFFEFESDVNMGDVKLSQMCEHMATLPQQRRIVFIFDRDNPEIIRKMSGDPAPYKDWGNNVFSLCLPVPEHRRSYKNLSIELYYSDALLKTPAPDTGRRLWFSNEIEIVTKPSNGARIYRAQPQASVDDELVKKVFDQPADQIVDYNGNQVGMSKSAFADMITKISTEKSKIDFSGFDQFFQVLKELQKQI